MPKVPVTRALTAGLAALALAATGLAVTAAPAAADPVTVSGVVSSPAGAISDYGQVQFYDKATGQNAYASIAPTTGAYSVEMEPGTYTLDIHGGASSNGATTEFADGQGPVTIDGPRTLNLQIAAQPVQVTITDAAGTPVAGTAMLRCSNAEFYDTAPYRKSTVTTSPSDPRPVWGIPLLVDDGAEPACLLGATRAGDEDETPTYYERVVVQPDTTALTIAIPDSVTLSGSIAPPGDDDPSWVSGSVDVEDGEGNRVAQTPITDPAHYQVQVPPGHYIVELRLRSRSADVSYFASVEVGNSDTTFDLGPDRTVPLTIHLENAALDGEWSVNLDCVGRGRGSTFIYPEGAANYLRATGYGTATDGTATITMRGVPTMGDDAWEQCVVYAQNGDDIHYGDATIAPHDAHMTWDLETDEIIGGSPGVSVDSDGVEDNVEAQAPNRGDGNNDGVPDYQQDNVTSVPTNGSAAGPDVYWMTLVAPEGTKLASVTTTDPAGIATPPPSGATLPAGLTNFTVTGLTPGADATVSVINNLGVEVNAYAKYNPSTSAWTLLPADRMNIFDYGWRIDITLTDGGIGDSDGIADGKVVDPGGPAAIASGDTTPPTVTGHATTRPNGAGWYRGNVRIDWHASDQSGIKRQPADTTVSTEGSNVTATSPLVCDKAPTPNCGRGTLEGLKIDKTAPQLAVTGVSNGATYTLGNVPTPSCSASDALSGLAAPCKGIRSGGNAAGVGTFTYTTAVTDRAGNTRSTKATYKVGYRFDGFLPPINDPGPPMSVFKAGSTVPVAITIKKANGQVVTPVSKPTWVTPSRGARTNASVNESVSNASGTSGSAFVWRNGRWEFNWSTRGVSAGYVYRIGVRLDDGSTHYVNIGVR